MHPRIAPFTRLAQSPASVAVDKVRDHFWSLVEQHLPIGGAGPAVSPWSSPAVLDVPASERAICLSLADMVLGGQIMVFGRNVTFTRQAPDWLADPFSRLSWPRLHHSEIDVLDLTQPSDARAVWEINRCQHLIPLAQAFALTGDERYAQACVEHMEDWAQQNPHGIGINWTSSMEVAIRGVVWSWVWTALNGARVVTPDRSAKLLNCLWAHAQHIDRHLEHEEHSGNHYLANGLGLIVLGSTFRGSRRGQSWMSRGRRILDDEIPRQFYADGVNYEGSVAYHGLALEIALLAQVALERSGASLSSTGLERLERALDVTLALTRPDGSFPPIGDVDDGQVLPLRTRTARSHVHLLAIGSILFRRPDLARPAVHAASEVAWLLGENAVAALLRLGNETSASAGSRAFPQGGLFVQRSEDCHLTIDCADVGSLGRGGHGHSDLLSIECFALGQPLIVDAGTFAYSSNPTARDRYRSTAQHNSLTVDDRETLEPADLWGFQQAVHPRLLKWSTAGDVEIFGGEYDLPGQYVSHARWVTFDRQRGAWLIDDRIKGSGTHHLVLRFHVPSMEVELTDDGACVGFQGSVGLFIQRIEPSWAKPRVDATTVSPMYLQEALASVVVFEGSASLNARCLTALVPYEGQCPDRDSIREWARLRELPPDASSPRYKSDAASQ
ncbi:MAG TPA: alginate lyase family protein [Chloroflexota bacterium]|nr:alginate lyase family protein [Chloroflexota bacterium]